MNADSVKAKLKNFAVSSGCTFQQALVYYGLERTIYRISVSPYTDHFILKATISVTATKAASPPIVIRLFSSILQCR